MSEQDGWGPGSPDLELAESKEEEREQEREEEEREAASEPEEEEQDSSPSEEAEEPEEELSAQEKAMNDDAQSILHEFEQAGDDSDEWRSGSVQDFLPDGEYGFLPVFGFNESNIAAKQYVEKHGLDIGRADIDSPTQIGGRDLSWWEDNSIMPKHPMVLVNPLGFSYIDEEVYDFRETFRFRKGEHFVFSDSGGYQIMSRDEAEMVDSREEHDFGSLQVYPERLVEWQVANADAGATIDFPPYNISGDSNFPDAPEYGPEWREFFNQRKERSGEMTKRMATRLSELREEGDHQADDFIFAPVIHGKPHPQDPHQLVREWHEEMESSAESVGEKPRGWVLKPEPAANFGQIAFMLAYAEEHLQDAEFIHVLMVGGLLQKTLIQYYAMNSDQFVTSDASSYAAGGKRRQFDLPKTATRRSVIISDRSDEDDDVAMDPTRLDRHPCRCQVCSIVEKEKGFEFIAEGAGSARSVTLNMHNLHQALGVERTFDALLREDDTQIVETGGEPKGSEFWRYVRSMGQDKRIEDLYRAMDYLRIAQEEGLDEANSTYRIKWAKSDGKTIDRGAESGKEVSW